MGDMKYGCPLCCNETFNSKHELTAHLANVLQNLHCPICNNKWSSVHNLLEHLTLDNCQTDISDDLAFEDLNKLDKRDENGSSKIMFEINENEIQNSSDHTLEAVDGSDVNKMCVDLLDKQILKPGLENQDLKLVKADDGNRYMIVTNEDADFTIGSTIVTKQNTDGTISFTSIADMTLEPESEKSAGSPIEGESMETEEHQEEIYSCNTCGVSFTSVLDHIQNYHGHQEVVVEEPVEQPGEPDNGSTHVEYNSLVEENTTTEQQAPRRVITDTGDIVEAPMNVKTEQITVQEEAAMKDTKERDKQIATEHYEQINNMCENDDNSVEKDIHLTEENKGPYHKVIVKEAETDQGTTVKLLYCLTCNIYVSSLSEFKSYPCKTLKYTCPHCPMSYETSKSLSAHMKVHTTKTVQEEASIKVTTEKGKQFLLTKHCVQVKEVLCKDNSIVKDIKPSEGKKNPYHKVIVKKAETEQGTTVKLLHCLICNIYVNSLSDFKSYPCKRLKYVCQHCPMIYENSKSLCAHMKVHKTKTVASAVGATYECVICSTLFPTNKSLKLHKRMHDPIKSRPIQPPVANTDGSEPSVKQYECNVCEKMIPLEYKTIHQNSHKTNDEMTCRVCNKKFSSTEYLEMHINVHNLDKAPKSNQDKSLPYNCLFCSRRFARPHEKVKHERIHTGEKPHSCEICGKSFRVSYCLTLHMRTHTGARPYACPHCPKRFKAHSVYNHHLLTHSEVRAYKCTFCPKTFKTAVQLAGHKNSHTKPFSCQQCNRPFASLYAVRIHTETHARQNNLKFSCSLCGASYARAFALKDHVKQVHKHDVDTDNMGQEEDWMIKEKPEALKVPSLETTKDLSEEMTELEMDPNVMDSPVEESTRRSDDSIVLW